MEEHIRKDIESRTPKEWYGLATPKGWDELVANTHRLLRYYFPSYQVHQIKEKFGTLCYYTNLSYENEWARAIIDGAEAASAGICQNCGTDDDTVKTRDVGPIATLCDPCGEAKQTGYQDYWLGG